MFVTGGTASFTSCEFTSNSATSVRLRSPPPPALARAAVAAAAHPPNPALTALARLHASQGAVLYVNSGTATFASTHPANSFAGNTASNSNNYGNCYKDSGTTITGSCG